MKTDKEIHREAKGVFDRCCIDESVLSWTVWKQAYLHGFRSGVVNGIQIVREITH